MSLGRDWGEPDQTEAHSALVTWLQSKKTFDLVNYDPTDLCESLIRDLTDQDAEVHVSRELRNLAAALLDKVKDEANIHAEVPVMIYTGDKEHWATVFERINTQGSPLTKYKFCRSMD